MMKYRAPAAAHRRNDQIGFTLIELAIVMVVAGLLLVPLLRMAGSAVVSTRLKGTQSVLETASEVLIAYALDNGGCLPFAADFEGGYPDTDATGASGGYVDTGVGRANIRDNLVVLELELTLYLIESDQTGGWLSSHFDIVDKFSPAGRPDAGSAYTHKLNFELDTALRPFNSLSEGRWLRNLETEVSIDYVATGIPKAGDDFGDVLFLDDASPWSLSLVLVLPLAPLNP